MKKYFCILAMVALGLSACNDYEMVELNGTRVYHLCIPASMGEEVDTKAMSFDNSGATPTSTSTFSESELVFVYNNTKEALLEGYLQPTNLSNDGKNCDLTGDLAGEIDPGDELTLYYNPNYSLLGLTYYFLEQVGTAASVLDGAIATVSVSEYSDQTLKTATGARFSNIASMFRFKFEDEDHNPIEVHSLTVRSINNSLIGEFQPLNLDNSFMYCNISLDIDSPSAEYLYMSLFFDENESDGSDALTFIAENSTHVFRGTKTAPATGFKNGKYYYNTAAIQLTDMGALQTPAITWTHPGEAVAPGSEDHIYQITTDGIDIGLTGTSLGYSFSLNELNESSTSTVGLNNLSASKYDSPFIVYANSLLLTISGTNSIDCRDEQLALSTRNTLKLQGSGTLTVTSNIPEFCGILGLENYNPENNDCATTAILDVSTQLAADNYRVVRSARTDNPDGSYTWTYTVAPASEYPASVDLDEDYSLDDEEELRFYAARDGQTLTGGFGGYSGYITVADGATVTLYGVEVDSNTPSIICQGNATIILEGENNLSATNGSGIYVPAGKTLTIRGTGSLVVFSEDGAGIGAYRDHPCGSIVIEGGTIDTEGGNGSAGIGGTYQASCQDITISGGTIRALSGVDGAGIGGGKGSYSSCGNITISGGIIKRAVGISGGAGIGSGEGGSCGDITISGGTIGDYYDDYWHEGAKGGDDAASIGMGDSGSCGDIRFGVDITYVLVQFSDDIGSSIGYNVNEIGNCGDIYFGDQKIYDKEEGLWYDGLDYEWNYYDFFNSGGERDYGGIYLTINYFEGWELSPAAQG